MEPARMSAETNPQRNPDIATVLRRMSANAPGAPQTFTRLVDLPVELRHEIYSHVYNPGCLRIRRRSQQSDICMYRAPLLHMMCVNRQFRDEYLDAIMPRAELRLNAAESLGEYETFLEMVPSYVYERLHAYHLSLIWRAWIHKQSGDLKLYLTSMVNDLCGTGVGPDTRPPRLPALQEVNLALHVTAAAIGMATTYPDDSIDPERCLSPESLRQLETVSTPHVRVHVKLILDVPYALQDRSKWGRWLTSTDAKDSPRDQISCWDMLPTSDDNNLHGFFPKYIGSYGGHVYRPVADAAIIQNLREAGKLRPEDEEPRPSDRYGS